jgi:hypothetical protein
LLIGKDSLFLEDFWHPLAFECKDLHSGIDRRFLAFRQQLYTFSSSSVCDFTAGDPRRIDRSS